MNKQLELVKEFQESFQQPTLTKNQDISIERRKLRLSLLFEELTELADAYGLKGTLFIITNKYGTDLLKGNKGPYEDTNFENIFNTNILNKVEVLDATGDLAYILAGTILENGQQKVFDSAFEDIHNSNMSKLCTIDNPKEVEETVFKYLSEGVTTQARQLNKSNYVGIFRISDNKILKNINYKPVDLTKYI